MAGGEAQDSYNDSPLTAQDIVRLTRSRGAQLKFREKVESP
jgi:hypothetical protein